MLCGKSFTFLQMVTRIHKGAYIAINKCASFFEPKSKSQIPDIVKLYMQTFQLTL